MGVRLDLFVPNLEDFDMLKDQNLQAMIVGVVARGLAWGLATHFGVESAQANSLAQSFSQAAVAAVFVGVSIYWSIQSRSSLKKAPAA